jgi:hypothetical protein
VPDQHADLYSVISLKQQSADRHVAPLGHIILNCGGHFENGDGRNFSMSGINSGHHYLPTYHMLMISDNVEFLRYCGGQFENGDISYIKVDNF